MPANKHWRRWIHASVAKNLADVATAEVMKVDSTQGVHVIVGPRIDVLHQTGTTRTAVAGEQLPPENAPREAGATGPCSG